jgi:hypothetical protein
MYKPERKNAASRSGQTWNQELIESYAPFPVMHYQFSPFLDATGSGSFY